MAQKSSPPQSQFSPPASLESEQAILGAILVKPDNLEKVADFLAPGDFYRTAHGVIYQTMLDLMRKGEPVDLVTVTGLLSERGHLDGVGGPVFLAGLSEQVGFATNAEHYARVVHDKATLRILLAAAQDIASSCITNSDVSARELVEKAQVRIAEVLEGARYTKGKYISKRIRNYAENIEGNFELPRLYKDLGMFTESNQKAALMALKRMVAEGILAKVKPGVYRMISEEAPRLMLSDPMVDAEIDMRYPMGLERWFITYPKTVILVAGEPDAGKTAFLLNIARLNFHLPPPQYYWTSEMGLPELIGRVENFDDYNAAEWDRHVEFHERSTDFADMIKLYPNAIHYIDNLEMDDEFYRVGGLIDSIWKALKNGVAIIALHKDPGKAWALGGVGSAKRPRLYLSLEPKKDHSGNIMRVRKFKNWRDKVTNIKSKVFNFKLVKGCKIIYDDPPVLPGVG